MTTELVSSDENYFDHDADIGIIGRGDTLEDCFISAARALFSLMGDVKSVHLLQVITFEFEEEDRELALVTWLNLLIAKAQEHHLMLGDFRLEHKDTKWRATISGEPWQATMERGIEVKGATLTMLSVKKINQTWEARCVVDV